MNKNKLTLRDYLLMAMISVLFGIIYLLAVYAGTALTTVLTPMGLGILGYEPFYGIWFMAAIITTYLIRKPVVGIVTEVIAALIEVLLGNMFGVMVLVSAFIQGVGVELPFTFTRYEKYSYRITMLSAFSATLLSFLWTGFRSNYLAMDWRIVAAIFVVRLLSSLFFTGYLSKLICDKLDEAGILNQNLDTGEVNE
ncbi:energy-coupling factor transport system substrate-specific component [Alkalibacterium putridalgicola]|uniref:Energy-coupling factor transport system substrate-specific component n=1 Tax=Alkalibacterium putridalgicola TaxID=426703 RepID=A0A1H7WH84_9LACT|nr:ECF transporter S component [Alkalibacterium putridalgicola]GEK90017.1 putative HMP/thiamine permease protein YkoE [Alkalibacterium putridalgicola]SEM20936.1 energy-coupling factor transport system substrate-specific component [Alkalibacterium putridalgicola]